MSTGAPRAAPAAGERLHALLVHPAYLGDTVFLGPAVRALKARWPGGRVTLVVSARGAPVARLLPGCDEVVVFDKRKEDAGLRGLWRLGRRLRAMRPDLALVSHYSPRSGALAWLSGAPRRPGYAPLCSPRVALDRSRPFVERALRLAALVGAPGDSALSLTPPAAQAAYADRLLAGAARPVLGLVPGAEWATKRWPAAGWAELAGSFRGTALILGGPAERELAAEIAARAGARAVIDSTGNSIEEAVALLARCDLVVGGDTGLTHCARALGRRTLTLFGPTHVDRHLFGPRDRPLSLGLDCQPCHDHGPERCPLGHHHCMLRLEARSVTAAAQALLDGAP